MKKLFKSLLSVMIAVIMCFATVTLASCKSDDSDDGDQNNGTTPGITGSTSEITALFKAMNAQKTDYFGTNMTMNSSNNGKGYHVDETGAKKNDGYSSGSNGTYKMDFGMKINAKTGDGDIAMKTDSKEEYTSSSSSSPSTYENKDYEYIFLRDWNIFAASGADEEGNPAEITDFSKETLMWAGDIEEMYQTGLEETGYAETITAAIEELFGVEFNLGNLASSLVLPYAGYIPAMLADSLDAFTLNGNKATADFNLAAYNLVQKVKGVLDTVNSDTTIGDILANETVKSLITAYTASFTADDVKGYIDLAIEQITQIKLEGGATVGDLLESQQINLPDYIVAPDANSTVYDYIVKIVSSNELKGLLNAVLKMITDQSEGGTVITMPTTLNNMTIDFFLNLAGTTIAEVKEYFNEYTQYITATEFKFIKNTPTYEGSYGYYDDELEEYVSETYTLNIPTNLTVSLTNLKLEYTLDGNTVTAMSANGNYSSTNTDVSVNGSYNYETGKYEYSNITLNEYTNTTTVSLQAEFPSNAYTLENINGNTAVFSQEEWTENCNGNTSYLHCSGTAFGIDGYIGITGSLSVKDGKVTGVTYRDNNDNPLTVGKDGKVTFNYTYWDWETDEEKTVPVTLYLYEEERYGDYYVYATAEPTDDYHHCLDYMYFYQEGVRYSNTVEGLLKGTPSTKLVEQ